MDEKLLAMIKESEEHYDKTLQKLASGEPEETTSENKEDTDGRMRERFKFGVTSKIDIRSDE